MSDTSGPASGTLFAWYDRETSCWRTSQGTFLSGSDLFSETWPRSGTTRAGCAYELPTPALPTGEPGSSSLLPTPMTVNTTSERAQTGRPTSGPQRGGPSFGLQDVVSLLPTPVVNDMGAGKTPEAWDEWTDRMKASHATGNGHGPSLSIEVPRLLPTPTASDTNGAGAHGDGGADLRTTVSLLPTPRATDGEKGGPNQRGSSGDLSGAPMSPPSDAGKPSSDAPLPGQLSLDATGND